MIVLVFLLSCLTLAAGYFVYGGFLYRTFCFDRNHPAPAHPLRDGVDLVAARTPVLFGHHFSSIAGAGPIVGPIAAAAVFGWVPALAWILVGAVFIGGVHDFSALMMSIRHRARSIAEICRLYLNPVTYRFLLVFIWLALVYVLIVFLDLTASTFAPRLAEGLEPAARQKEIQLGGAVATASIFYVALAVVFGQLLQYTRLGLRQGSLIFVPLVFLGLVFGFFFPLHMGIIPAGWIHTHPMYTWSLVLLIYCLLASITPVWALLQPRDYLSAFLLFACLGAGGLGLILSGLLGRIPIQYAAFRGYHDPALGYIFPALFITVACGAVSGFHSVVASGTTAKQLPNERAARPVAYGGMLTEAVLALVALAAVMIMPVDTKFTNPMAAFSNGIGRFLAVFGLPVTVGRAFGLLAISTFLLTTLDTCTRLARYLLEELFGMRHPNRRYVSTVLTLMPVGLLAFARYENPTTGALIPAWKIIWPAFGTTNQLLAALALLVVVIWRRAMGRSIGFLFVPMLFMMATTGTSMVQLIHQHLLTEGGVPLIGWINLVMMFMTLLLILDTVTSWGKLSQRAREVTGAVGAG